MQVQTPARIVAASAVVTPECTYSDPSAMQREKARKQELQMHSKQILFVHIKRTEEVHGHCIWTT